MTPLFISHLYIKNFGIIQEADLYFNKGLNLILGSDNGSGKTTILEAISLLLFNKINGTLEGHICWTPGVNAKGFKLSMDFILYDQECHQDYIYENNSGNRNLTIGDQFATNSNAVKLLGRYLDVKQNLSTIFAFEDSVDLIAIKPSERREHLKNLYDLDFKKGIEDIDNKIKIENEKIIDVDKKMFSIENYSYNYYQIKELPYSQEEVNKFQKEVDTISTKMLSIDNDKKRKNSLSIALEEEKNKIDKINKAIEDKKDSLVVKENNIQNLKKKVDRGLIEKAIEDYKKNIQSLMDNDGSKKIKDEMESIILERVPIFDEGKLSNLRTEANQIEGSYKSLRDGLITMKEKKSCPVCGTPATEEHIAIHEQRIFNKKKILDDIKKEVSSLEDQYNKIQDIIKRNNAKTEERNRLLKRIQDIDTRIQSDIDLHKSLIKSKKEELNKFDENFDRQLKVLEEAYNETILAIKDLEKEKEESLKKVLNIEEEINSIYSIDNDQVTFFIKEKESLLSKIQSYNNIIQENKINAKNNEDTDLLKSKHSVQLNDLKLQKNKVLEELKRYDEEKNILRKSFPTFVLQFFIKTIEKSMNEFLKKTYNNRYTISIQEKKDAMYIYYGPSNAETSYASGYEKALFSLAYKDALNHIQSLKFLILDEVDKQAMSKNSLKLYEMMGEMIEQEQYNQIITITHVDKTQGFMESSLNATIFYAKDGYVNKLN